MNKIFKLSNFYFELFLNLLFIFIFYLTFEYNLNKKPNYLSGGVELLGVPLDGLFRRASGHAF